jgi:hypothetical protein
MANSILQTIAVVLVQACTLSSVICHYNMVHPQVADERHLQIWEVIANLM